MFVDDSPANSDPERPEYIGDELLRDKVNAKIQLMRELAIKAKKGDRSAEADYHRAAADLMDIRPALTDRDEKRQQKHARHLRRLANRIEGALVPTQMWLPKQDIETDWHEALVISEPS